TTKAQFLEVPLKILFTFMLHRAGSVTDSRCAGNTDSGRPRSPRGQSYAETNPPAQTADQNRRPHARLGTAVEFDQKVEIACLGFEIPGCRGTEQIQALHAETLTELL
ncbi:MAG TPA: hypothetical protein VK138_11540, partial [Acidiferrobacterales bacterium]|nr:hypothetical protein [Acidiferrobacterales bacterium]